MNAGNNPTPVFSEIKAVPAHEVEAVIMKLQEAQMWARFGTIGFAAYASMVIFGPYNFAAPKAPSFNL